MRSPTISVIMPVYNGEQYLRLAINSILNQSYQDFEFIIINDGSTDNTQKIITSFTDERIKLINNKKAGISSALNLGISKAKGLYIARQDADDISSPSRFQEQVAFLGYNPDVGLVGSCVNILNEQGHILEKKELPIDDQSIRQVFPKQNPFIHGATMFFRTHVENAGGYRKPFVLAQDYDLWLRMAEHCQMANLSNVLYEYRVSFNSISYRNRKLYKLYFQVAQELAIQRLECGNDVLSTEGQEGFYKRYGRLLWSIDLI